MDTKFDHGHSSLVLLLVLTLIVFNANAQVRYVDVAPDPPGEIGALNRAIIGDTTASGERIDPENTVYRLERNGTYSVNLSIRNAAFPVAIEAAEGNGDRPLIRPGVTIEGNTDVPFRPLNDFRIKGLKIIGRDANQGLVSQLLRIQAEDVRVVIDDCVFDESSQSAVRTDTRGAKIFITNSEVSRMGTPDDVNNGRVVDDRNNFIDTLVMENNTFYNITSTIVRDGSGADSFINQCKFNQNTLYNIGVRISDFGPVIDFTFTNNIIVNGSFLAGEQDPDPFDPTKPDPNDDPPSAGILLDSVDQSILDAAGVAQTAIISHNNIYTTSATLDALPDVNPDPVDSDLLVPRPIFNSAALEFISAGGTEATNIIDTIDFQNAVPDPIVFIQEHWNSFDGSIIPGPWNFEGAPFDFRYNANQISATASSSSGPLGDLNWGVISFNIDGLLEAIAEGEDLLTASTQGNNIGNVPTNAFDSLTNMVARSKGVAENPSSTEEDVEAAVTDLRNAIEFFLSNVITSTAGDLNPKKLLMYPIPVKSNLHIIADEGLIEELEVINTLGFVIKRFEGMWNHSGEFDLSSLKDGMYLVNIKLDSGDSVQQRIIIQK